MWTLATKLKDSIESWNCRNLKQTVTEAIYLKKQYENGQHGMIICLTEKNNVLNDILNVSLT